MGRDGQQHQQHRQHQQPRQQQQYPRKQGQQQQGGRRPNYNGGGERQNHNHGQSPPGGGWLSVAHHKGEGARERQVTSHLKNAGNADGVAGLLEKAEEYLGELNAVHCTMIINR